MLGAITGDTIGSSYEFQNTKDYNFEMFRNDSNYTDDSIMTMAVAKWLLDDPEHSLRPRKILDDRRFLDLIADL